MDTMSLNATARTDFGKGAARKIRGTGMLPAVVYRGGNDSLSITTANDELETIFRKTMNRNTLIKLESDGGGRICLVKAVQRHPVSQRLRHVDFFEVDESEEVRVVVKVVAVGTALGTKMGGRLQIVRRDLKIVCKPGDIPAQVEVDVSTLDVGGILSLSSVQPPKGCKISYLNDFNIATVIGKRGELEEAEDEAEAVAEAPEASEE
jgi:large subunit ribosomal protein L25